MSFMVVFGKRRQKAIAPFILAFWLFAIFVSVAHACGLDEDIGHTYRSEAAMVGGHDGTDDGASSACDKFCSDDLAVLGKLKAVQDPPTGHAFVVPQFVGGSFQTTVAPVPSLLPSPDPPPGINVNIRFVRLAL
jgi:hypothetical protein